MRILLTSLTGANSIHRIADEPNPSLLEPHSSTGSCLRIYSRSSTDNNRSKSLARQIVRKLKNQSGSVTIITLPSGPPGVTNPK